MSPFRQIAVLTRSFDTIDRRSTRRASTWQLQLSHWVVRATYDAAQPTTSVDTVEIVFCAEDLTG